MMMMMMMMMMKMMMVMVMMMMTLLPTQAGLHGRPAVRRGWCCRRSLPSCYCLAGALA
jgi:hypothetical protein